MQPVAHPNPNSVSDQRPASHIVVFRRTSEDNERAVAEAIGAVREEVAPRGTVRVFRSEDPSRVPSRVYRGLRVAAVDIDPERARQLDDDPGVVGVFVNQQRRIPPFIIHDEPPLSASSALLSSQGVSDPALAYLHGVRAAADAAIAFLGGVSPMGIAAAPMPKHSWGLDLVGVPEGYTTATGRGVRVAVLDTGIDLKHPDFGGSVTDGSNAMSFVPGASSAHDGNGHGTHCAGSIAGPRQSQGGQRYGVAPDVELLVGKVLDDFGSGYDDWILEGIDWARDNGAQIISMSLGKSRSPGEPFDVAYEVVAQELLDLGILIVAASGNESARPGFTKPVGNPAACPSILSVAAVDRLKRIGYFSCCEMPPDSARVDLSAPGVAVYSAWKGGGFRTISGTSMATPHVAGIAALWAEREGLGGQDLWNRLTGTAAAVAPPTDFGAGIAQAP